MRLIFVRHGETEENTNRIIQGQKIHGKLSEKGIEQAKRLAERLKDEKIDCIYCSDSKRAADTAEEIAKYHPDTKIELVEELRERNYGKFEGKKVTDVPDWDKIKLLPDYDMDGGETMSAFSERIDKFLQKVFQKHMNQTVVWVSHAGIGRCLIAIVANKPMQEVDQELSGDKRIKNAGISVFEIREDKKHKIHLLNDTTHLA